jgi:adenylate cyclase class IV
MGNMENIEIEFRAIVTKEKHDWLNNFLLANAKDLGQDDKVSVFYIMPDKLFKVVNETSKEKAKIVLKDNHISSGSNLKEWEVKINSSEFDVAVDLFSHMALPAKIHKSFQRRHNYVYKYVEIAVKYSEEWQYHIEMEIVVDDVAKKSEAEQKIKALADKLDIKLMTNQEIKNFTKAFEDKLKQKLFFAGECKDLGT